MLISGPVGTGKTTFATFIAVYERIFKNLRFEIAKFETYFSSSTRVFDDEYSRKLSALKYFPVLIIDDFALTKVNEDYVLPRLYDVIDSRYSDGKKTIFTTNTGSRSDIESKVGVAIADRIFESCRVMTMKGESFRRKA